MHKPIMLDPREGNCEHLKPPWFMCDLEDPPLVRGGMRFSRATRNKLVAIMPTQRNRRGLLILWPTQQLLWKQADGTSTTTVDAGVATDWFCSPTVYHDEDLEGGICLVEATLTELTETPNLAAGIAVHAPDSSEALQQLEVFWHRDQTFAHAPPRKGSNPVSLPVKLRVVLDTLTGTCWLEHQSADNDPRCLHRLSGTPVEGALRFSLYLRNGGSHPAGQATWSAFCVNSLRVVSIARGALRDRQALGERRPLHEADAARFYLHHTPLDVPPPPPARIPPQHLKPLRAKVQQP